MYKLLFLTLYCIGLGCLLIAPTSLHAENKPLIRVIHVSAANTFADSGLLDELNRAFTRITPGTKVEVKSAGALSVLDHGWKGDADIVITHHPMAEERFLKSGFGISRTPILSNSFILLGPKKDPLGVSNETHITNALKKIAADQSSFIAPSQRSGTYNRLMQLWQKAGVTPDWPGYEISGAGVLSTLRNADLFEEYTLVDAGTYFSAKRSLSGSIRPLFIDGDDLKNTYSAIVVAKPKSQDSHLAVVNQYVKFLISPEAHKLIHKFNMNKFGYEVYRPVASL